MNTILTPMDLGNAEHVKGRLWRKQILPIGSIDYKGRRIDFTRDRLQAMADAFEDEAYDSVPLVFADAENRHTMDPRQVTGEVIGMEVTADGLDVLVRPSAEARSVLAANPKVGISARIVEDYDRADGKHYPAAIQHALITTDPRIPGLRPWEAVDLSSEPGEVLDLSTLMFVADSGDENDTTKETTVAGNDTPLSADEAAQFRALLPGLQSLLQMFQAGGEPDDDTEPDMEPETTSDADPEITDEELERIALEAFEEQPDEEPEPIAAANDGVSVELSNALELANAQREEQALELANLRTRLEERDFEAERDRLANDHGIPPAITDLARPLLQGSHVLDLSNGEQVDAGQVVREVFKAIGEHVTLLDLSGPAGKAVFEANDKDDPAARADQAKADRAALGV